MVDSNSPDAGDEYAKSLLVVPLHVINIRKGGMQATWQRSSSVSLSVPPADGAHESRMNGLAQSADSSVLSARVCLVLL